MVKNSDFKNSLKNDKTFDVFMIVLAIIKLINNKLFPDIFRFFKFFTIVATMIMLFYSLKLQLSKANFPKSCILSSNHSYSRLSTLKKVSYGRYRCLVVHIFIDLNKIVMDQIFYVVLNNEYPNHRFILAINNRRAFTKCAVNINPQNKPWIRTRRYRLHTIGNFVIYYININYLK